MKILILHPEDELSARKLPATGYDLVVDLGKAPPAAYSALADQAGCNVISLQDFAGEQDLQINKSLAQLGNGKLTDQYGIDWWNMFAPAIVPDVQQLVLVGRLAKTLPKNCELHSSRSGLLCVALQRALNGRLIARSRRFRKAVRKTRHWLELISKFEFEDLLQIAQDKFDAGHEVRRRFAKKIAPVDCRLNLLPSAYINVSRTAIELAELIPNEKFLLVCARNHAKVRALPPNVEMISLDSYFGAPGVPEISALLHRWEELRPGLSSSAEEYKSGSAAGLFDSFPSLLRWGIIVRDAWLRLFAAQKIRSCFCADHNNPYTRIPLLLAKHAGLPAVVCHHGALDWGMAITTHDADFYLARNLMDHDYMERVCGMDPSKLVMTGVGAGHPATWLAGSEAKPWMVFFSEPYELSRLRSEQFYADLLPYLYALAEALGIEVVFKLHPFETHRGHLKMLKRHLSAEKVRGTRIITGPITEELWANARFALTAQSSVALECKSRGIPIFLCGWLRDPFSGYVQQYQKFRVGYLLKTAAEIREIPQLLQIYAEDLPENNYSSSPPRCEISSLLAARGHSLLSPTQC